ncbi:unnamed protein product [Caenorhabditis nigoni]
MTTAFEIIDPNEPVDENKLPNGMEVIHHDVNAFSNHYVDGKSFDDLKKKKVESGAGIHFGVDFKLHPDGLKKLSAVGQAIQSNNCILQHNLVMYSFVYSITVVGQNEKDGLYCKLSIVPVGYTFKYPTEMVKGGVAVTYKPQVPDLENVKWVHKDGTEIDLVKEDNGFYSCQSMVTLSSFENFTENGVAVLRVEMTIDKDYFEIGEYINLNLKEAHVAPSSYKILDKILMGEKVPKSDWILSAGEGFPRDFHVHGPVLADASIPLRAAVTSHMSIGKEIAMISHENRFIITSLKSKDMRVILTYIYHRRFVLPDFDAVSRIGKILSLLFRDDIFQFFDSWNVELIKSLKKLDRSDTLKTVSECVKALICVTCAPQGSLLGAYNVALIVAADAWQMAEAKGKKVRKEKVKNEIGESWPLIDDILELIDDFKCAVCGTEKMELVEKLDSE